MYKKFIDSRTGNTIVGVIIRSKILTTTLNTPRGEEIVPTFLLGNASENEYQDCLRAAETQGSLMSCAVC